MTPWMLTIPNSSRSFIRWETRSRLVLIHLGRELYPVREIPSVLTLEPHPDRSSRVPYLDLLAFGGLSMVQPAARQLAVIDFQIL